MHYFTDIALKMIICKILHINVTQQDFDYHHTCGSNENSSHVLPVWTFQSVTLFYISCQSAQSSLHPNMNDVKDCSFTTAILSFVVPASSLLVLILPQNEYRVEKSSAGAGRAALSRTRWKEWECIYGSGPCMSFTTSHIHVPRHSLSVWQTDRPFRLWDTHTRTHIVWHIHMGTFWILAATILCADWAEWEVKGPTDKEMAAEPSTIQSKNCLEISLSAWIEKPFLCEHIFVRGCWCLKVYFSWCLTAEEYKHAAQVSGECRYSCDPLFAGELCIKS